VQFIQDLGKENLSNKKVLLRADLNVPCASNNNGDITVTDLTRIHAIKESVHHLLNNGAKVLLLSHFGRPQASSDKSNWDKKYSLRFLTPILSQAFNKEVGFCEGFLVEDANDALKIHNIVLLENIRFALGEEENSDELAKSLAEGVDLYVNDAFSCSHRAHTSIEAITKILPSYAGLHLQKEVLNLKKCFENPEKPLTAIIGGSKVSTKLDLLQNLCQKVDNLIIGGAMANTFLKAKGYDVGQSMFEENMLETASNILGKYADKIVLPTDFTVSDDINSNETSFKTIGDLSKESNNNNNLWKIFDMGPKSIDMIKGVLDRSRTVVWNGPVGVFEKPQFAKGTMEIAQHLNKVTRDKNIMTVAGGGDTLAALAMSGANHLTYTSTAGGAFLEWLEGKELPGIKALEI